VRDFWEAIPDITKSEEKEYEAVELREYFPDENLTGLVVRRRKNSLSSIDVDDPNWMDNFSSRERKGSASFGTEESGVENFDEIISHGYRKRVATDGRFTLT
jgi:hypothetical protein